MNLEGKCAETMTQILFLHQIVIFPEFVELLLKRESFGRDKHEKLQKR